MTVQDIKDRIAEMIATTKKIIAQNPGMKDIRWTIEDIPYAVFDEFRAEHNRGLKEKDEHKYLSQSEIGGRMYCTPVYEYGNGAEIQLWSMKVKFRHTYEVLEEIKTKEPS